MRERFCRVCHGWHMLDQPWPHNCRDHNRPARSDTLAAPMYISDHMDPTEHIDGQHYDSKSAFRAVTKANGCIEVGNEPIRKAPKKRQGPAKETIVETIQKSMQQIGI